MEWTYFTLHAMCDGENCDQEHTVEIEISPDKYDNTAQHNDAAWGALVSAGWDVTSDDETLCPDCIEARRDLDPAIAEQIMEAQP